MADLIASLVSQYPNAVAVFSIIGILRAINKPLFAAFRAYTNATSTPKDDAVLDAVEKSKAYTYAMFILDYLTSVKVPNKE